MRKPVFVRTAAALTAALACGTAFARAEEPDRAESALPAGAGARLGTLRFRQGQWVRGLSLSPDGRTLASAGADGHVRLWDAARGTEVRSFQVVARGGCYAVAFAPDGKTLAVGADVAGVFLLDTASGKVVRQAALGSVRALAFAPDGKTLAVGELYGGGSLWDPATGTVVAQFRADDNAGRGQSLTWSLAFSPDGGRLAWGEGSQVLVREVTGGKQPAYAVPHPGGAWAVGFSPGGELLATSGRDNVVQLREATTGRPLRTFAGHKIVVTSLAFGPDGKLLATGSGDPLQGTGRELNSLRLWDVATGKERARLGRHTHGVVAVCFSRDGKVLYAAEDMSISRWDVASGLELETESGHQGWVGGVAFAPDGKTLATASSDRTVRLWDVATGKERRVLRECAAAIDSVTWSADGTRLAAGGRDAFVLLWDAATGKVVARLPAGENNWEARVAFAPDSKLLASGSRDGRVILWDAAAGKELRQLPRAPEGVMSLAFAPDGKLLATGHIDDRKMGKGTLVRLWDVASGQEVWRPEHPMALMVKSVTFAPDGRFLAAADWQGTIHCWDVATRKLVRQLAGQAGPANEVAFSPDGRMLASTSYDGTVRLWEMATGVERRRLLGHRGASQGIAFAPDGKSLASGGFDTTVLLWELRDPKPGVQPQADLSASEFEKLWAALAGTDGAAAHQAILRLAAVPERAVRLLREHLRPAVARGAEVDRLVADLDSEKFAVREKASAQLAELGERAEPALRRVLEGTPSAEVRRRVEALLPRMLGALLSGEPLRQARALEALEYCDTPEARRLLESLAQGAPDEPLTREAERALQRLDRRPTGSN
jgi:WD40 repeat protein